LSRARAAAARKNAYGLRRSDPDGGAARTGGGGGGEGGMVGKAGGGDGRRNAATPLGDRLPAPAQQHRSHQLRTRSLAQMDHLVILKNRDHP
jgi:hypothetical protein